MRKKRLTEWDPAEHLETEEDIVLYLDAALALNDPALAAAALGDVARARGMTSVAQKTGLSRESLYRALSPQGNPELSTFMKVADSLGLRLSASIIKPH